MAAADDLVATESDSVAVQEGVRVLLASREQARAGLATAGDWTTSEERIAAWRHVRDARSNALDLRRLEAVTPHAVAEQHPADEVLSATDVEVVHRVASDPGRLTRAWAEDAMAEIGEERYTELVAVVAIARTLDAFEDAMGLPHQELPDPVPSEPTKHRPDDVGDIGAWVSQSTGLTRANVSRTFSLVPTTNAIWRTLVDTHYSRGAQFMDLSWDRALTRPQVELVAARTTAGNECFY